MENLKLTIVNIVVLLLGFLAISYANLTHILFYVSLFIMSIYVLIKAADIFTQLAVEIGTSLGLSKLASGALIIAIGTSSPELFASIGAAFAQQTDMVIGTVLGTVIANSLLGIGFAAVFAKNGLVVHKNVIAWKMPVFFIAILLALVSLYDGTIDFYEALLMLPLLVYYLIFIYRSDKKPSSMIFDKKLIISISFLIINLIALFKSGDLVIYSLIHSAELLDLSGAKLATSILAIGTSIPEIATAIMLIKQNNADSLFGEIIGSNIFDILGIFGLIGLFSSISMANSSLLIYLIISMLATFMVVKVVVGDKNINKIEGASLILLFVFFTLELTKI